MKKITLFFVALLVSSMCFSQLTVTNLWEFSVQKTNLGTAVDDVKNGIAISPDGTKLYLSARAADASQVAIYNPATGVRTGYLPGLAGFASNYAGDVAVDGNGAIYASNVIIGASALKIAKWDNSSATPSLFISTLAHTGSGTNRIGYGMDVRINSAGNGFIIMHKNGTSAFLIWTITANVPTSQDPTIITAGTAITDSYARISIIDDNKFWVDGNIAKPWLATITKSGPEINATPTAIALEAMVNGSVGVAPGGMTEFMLSGNRYGVIAANNHGATYTEGHIARLQKLAATGAGVEVDVIATLPTAGLGKTSDASHFVESVVHVDGLDAYIYTMGGFNGITAHKVTAPIPSKTFTVKVPNGTEKVYIVGSFTGKTWDNTDPFELTATANANEFTGTFPCVDGVEYKYICGKADWDYEEAVYAGGDDPIKRANRTYNAADEVVIWFRVNKITLNASFVAGSAPSELYVKGSFDGWAAGVLMTKTGDTFSHVLGGNPGDKFPANTQYKYYTTEMGLNTLDHAENWETEADGAGKSNRWSIAPIMNDEVKRFESQSSGVFKVGTTPGADFASLSTAVTAINAATIKGNIVLEITSDITEAANIGLAVDTKGFGITIRPDADADRTITFTKTTDNTSPSGHFVIGYKGLTTAWSDANTIATNNVTIDGYALAGSTRRLKFTTANVSITSSKLTVIVGACENTTIKNCIYDNQSTGGSAQCIGMISRKGAAIEVSPNGVTIDNNIITAVKSTSGQGLNTTSSGTLTTAKTTGLVVKNNIITAQGRVGWFYYINGGDFYNNEFHLTQLGNANTVNYGLWTSTGASGTFNIYNNKFVETSTMEATATGALGMRTLSLAAGVYNIYNNMFSGLNKKSVAGATVNLTYIFFGGTSGHISHNTFYMPEITAKTTPGYYNAIQLSFANPDIKNNIFISEEDAIVNAFYSAVSTGEIDNNIYYNRAGSTKSLIVTGSSTLSAFQAANPTKDIHSKSVNVDFVNAAAGDLRIGGFSVQAGELAVPLLASVTTDMFGTVRTGSDRGLTYAGAHESILPFIFTSTANVESTARIMRTTTGVQVELDGEANIELYNMSGMLLDKVRANGTYSRNLDNGIYIIRINGKATKFIK